MKTWKWGSIWWMAFLKWRSLLRRCMSWAYAWTSAITNVDTFFRPCKSSIATTWPSKASRHSILRPKQPASRTFSTCTLKSWYTSSTRPFQKWIRIHNYTPSRSKLFHKVNTSTSWKIASMILYTRKESSIKLTKAWIQIVLISWIILKFRCSNRSRFWSNGILTVILYWNKAKRREYSSSAWSTIWVKHCGIRRKHRRQSQRRLLIRFCRRQLVWRMPLTRMWYSVLRMR